MTDTRFTTVCEDLEALLGVVDLDDADDLGTLLMALLDRPVGVAPGWDDERELDALDVLVLGDGQSGGVLDPFPLSILELARTGAELAQEIGPYARAGEQPIEGNDVLSLTDDELVGELKLALGRVRVFNMLEDD